MEEKIELAVIGQGPAGLSAAIYTSRAGISTHVYGCAPKVAGDYTIDNYFGFPESISGAELIERGSRQADRFGTVRHQARVLHIEAHESGAYRLTTETGKIVAKALILATGVSRIRPKIENLDQFEGKGVSYCVSCDGFFYRKQPVLVVGEGNFAANQALELGHYTEHVQVITQGKAPEMGADFRQRLDDQGVDIHQARIVRLEGDPTLARVILESGETMDAAGLFIAMGEASAADFAASLGLVQNGQFIEVDPQQATNLTGVFAAGDCVGRFLQISVAVGEGAMAAKSAIAYVKKKRKG